MPLDELFPEGSTTLFRLRGKKETREVWLDNKQLDPKPSQKLKNHSPDGFMWGYGGSGPAQLALAICLRIIRLRHTMLAQNQIDHAALRLYQDFKFMVIAQLPMDEDFDIEVNWEKFIQKVAEGRDLTVGEMIA